MDWGLLRPLLCYFLKRARPLFGFIEVGIKSNNFFEEIFDAPGKYDVSALRVLAIPR